MVMAKFDCTCGFSAVLDSYLLFVIFSDFQEAHIDEGLEEDLAFHFIDSDGQFDCDAVFADDFDDFCFVFKLFALIFDLRYCGES